MTGSIVRWEDGGARRAAVDAPAAQPGPARHRGREHPEILGDVFAWNKVFRRTFWDGAGLAWPEGVRYEDQPTTTRAYLAARAFDVLPEVVYHWRIRYDGTSITQQRSSVRDLADRLATKRMSLATVEEYVAAGGDPRRARGLPRPGARGGPAPLLHRDPRLQRRVVGAAARRGSRTLAATAR